MQSRRSIAAFGVLAALFLVAVASSAVPSPLYPVYAERWRLSPFQLTVVFASYMAGVLVSTLVAGRVSDHVGRKPVLVVGTLGIAVSHVVLGTAQGYGALVAGRVEQGLAVGVTLAALGAALLDHSLQSRPGLASTLNGAMPPLALATGALASGALVEWAPAPRQLVYAVFGSLLVLLTVALLVVPESVERRPGVVRSLRPVVAVPEQAKRLFRASAAAIAASWALGGLFLSLLPSVLDEVFGISDHFAAGALIAAVTGTAALTALLLQRTDPNRVLLLGLGALIAGPVLAVVFVHAHSLTGLVVGSVVAGVGFGAGFQAPVRLLLATASPSNRAGVVAAIYVVCYVAYGLPAVVAGLLVPPLGLTTVVTGYGAFVAVTAVAALPLHAAQDARTRPTTRVRRRAPSARERASV